MKFITTAFIGLFAMAGIANAGVSSAFNCSVMSADSSGGANQLGSMVVATGSGVMQSVTIDANQDTISCFSPQPQNQSDALLIACAFTEGGSSVKFVRTRLPGHIMALVRKHSTGEVSAAPISFADAGAAEAGLILPSQNLIYIVGCTAN